MAHGHKESPNTQQPDSSEKIVNAEAAVEWMVSWTHSITSPETPLFGARGTGHGESENPQINRGGNKVRNSVLKLFHVLSGYASFGNPKLIYTVCFFVSL